MKEGSLLALTRHWYLRKMKGRADNTPCRNVKGTYVPINDCVSRLDLLKYTADFGAHFPLLIQTSGRKISPGHKS